MILFDIPWVRASLEDTGDLSFGIGFAPLLFEFFLAFGPKALVIEIGREPE